MEITPLSIDGAWVLTPHQIGDNRGVFLEWYKSSKFIEVTGREFDLQQANCSVSSAGTLRGIHFTDSPPGQPKYVACVRGSLLDVIVDLRTDSPTFGKWESVLIDDKDRRMVYLSEGLGHAFLALEDNATIIYLCGLEYQPELDHEVNPLDPELGIDWPTVDANGNPLEFRLSAKDQAAPSLKEALAAGILPTL